MQKYVHLLILVGHIILAQHPVHNAGNLKVHHDGAMGFHHNLINNGSFDENLGLVGFFNEGTLTVSGAFRPVFHDMEVMVQNQLILQVGIGITNHLNFIDGILLTPRDSPDINTDFLDNAFYSGESADAMVDGYAMLTNKEEFRFPIGERDRIRPLLLEAEAPIVSAKSAYFFENPNAPSTFNERFDTDSFDTSIMAISTLEFWHLDTEALARVELIWDDRSNIASLVESIETLTVVGWHNEEKKWDDLGVTAKKGDLEYGRIVSRFFDTIDYSIITFGSTTKNSDVSLANYLITPNNDGINDFLVLEAIAQSPNNQLKIFNRWGRAVYEKENYTNGFNGKANTGLVVRKNKILPAGLYFYVIELKDLGEVHQGYLYINE